MAVTTTQTNKPINPRGNDQSPKGYNRAALYSGKALDFDGVNDNVEVSAFSTTGSTRSLSYYFKASTSGNKRVFEIKSGSNFFNSTIFNGKINTFDGVNGINTTKTFNDNKWHHVVITHNGNNNAAIYVDGVSQELDASTFSVHDITNQTLYIAGLISVYYDGGLSNIRLFNVALTAAQVADLYNNPEKVVPTGVDNTALKLWLPMQEGAGTTAYDGSGNGNHGTISGATWTHGIGAPVAQTAVIDWNKGTNIVQNTDVSASYWSAGSQVTRTGDQESVSGLYNSATLIEDTTTNASHWAGAAVSTSASTTYVQAAFVKKKDSGIYASLRTNGAGSNSFIVFDFDSATIVGVGSDIIDSGVIAFSNGWYRIWMKYTLAPSGIIIGVSNSTSAPIPAYAGTGIGFYADFPTLEAADEIGPALTTNGTAQTSPVLLPQGLTSGRDITGVNLFENVRKQGALNLDGNSWAEVHDNASVDLTTAISMECWAYIDDLVSTRVFFAKWAADSAQRAYVLYQSGDDLALTLSDGSNYGTSSTNVLTTGWHHIVATYVQNGNMTYYVDGSQTDAFAFTRAIRTTTAEIEIGRNEGPTGANYFKNQLAQPRIYNRALTAEEVERNYNAGKNIYQ